MGIKLPSYATSFSWLKKGCTTETPIFKSISRHNQKNIGFVLTSWIFLSFFFFFYRDLSSNNIVDLHAGVFSNLTNLKQL